jgi:predicted ATP-grasp superfamily ATP-dependent carboligase
MSLAEAGAGGAIVLGGEYRGLGIVRSLGRRNVPVWVLTDQNWLAATSRYVARGVPWPRGDDRARLMFLTTLASKEGLQGWTLFPTGDEDAAFIARTRSELSRLFRLTTPNWEQLRWTYDKRLTYALADRVGVPRPWTTCPGSRADVEAIDQKGPLILKPATKVSFNAFTHAKAWLARDKDELLRLYDTASQLVDPAVIMVQELIPGGGCEQYSFAALCKEGVPRASLVARRIRQYPPDFGRASTFVESIDDPIVEESATRLLQAIEFSGLIEVEFKRDPRDGQHKLLDLNPRVWGWHTLGERAGLDFPYLQWLVAHGEDIPEVKGRPNVRWIRLSTDLLAAAHALLRGEITPLSYARSFRRPVQFAIASLEDPAPAILDLPLLILQAVRRRAV